MAEPLRPVAPPASRTEALRFLQTLTDTVVRLAALLDEEAADLAAGRVRRGLSRESEKSELAGRYLRAAEAAKAHAVALARFAADEVARVREACGALQAAAQRNQAVVATALSVSEGLIRGVAEELARQARPAGYGAGGASPGYGRGGPGRPMLVSASF